MEVGRLHMFPHELYSTTREPARPSLVRSAPHEFYDGSMTTSWYSNGGFGSVPASPDAIACLPLTTVSAAGEVPGKNDQYCAVCQEGYEAGDRMRTMPCAHGFHDGCIVGWLSISRLCPLCRFSLPAEAEEEEELAAARRRRRPWNASRDYRERA